MNWETRLETVDIKEFDWLAFADWHEEYGDIDICKGIKFLQEQKKQPCKTGMSIELELMLTSRAIQEDIKLETSWTWLAWRSGAIWYQYCLQENIIKSMRDKICTNDDVHIEATRSKIELEFLSRFRAIITAAKALGELP